MIECLRKTDSFRLLAVQRAMEEAGYEINGLLIEPPLFPGGDVNHFMTNPSVRSFFP